MNADAPSLVGSAFPPGGQISQPPVRLLRLIVGLVAAVAAFDSCFWGVGGMGISVAVFVVVLAGLILRNRETLQGNKVLVLLLALLGGAVLATVIETGTTNTLVLVVLIAALAGYTFYVETESLWGRLLSQAVAIILAPGRIFWLVARLLEATVQKGLGGLGGLVGRCLLVLPALILALIFGSLLSTGNAVFGSWTSSFFDWFWNELELYADFWRIAMWGIVAFLVLPFLRPANISPKWWRSTVLQSQLPEIIPSQAALFSSGLVLTVLNLMFFVANLADILFLWSGDKLPQGVTYSGFVHNGTNALTITAILSAFVLATIFQQEFKVSRNRILKGLGLVWITQNLFLLLSVALRLKLYIEAYDMTVLRLSVIIFLALVGIGYLLLTIKILLDRSLAWLIGGCVLATFGVFYVTQFLNLSGWSANYNVSQWEKDRGRNLDVYYLFELGPAAWPALRHATELGATWPDSDRNDHPHDLIGQSQMEEAAHPQASFDWKHWHEFSLLAWMNRGALEDKPYN
jgi:hypothetical protein